MHSSATVRHQIESALSQRIPSALTPPQRQVRPVVSTGIGELDELIQGGLPVGAVTELVGSECSGRTSVALSFLAHVTSTGKVCAWLDASNTFNPSSAAAVGVDLKRLLWIRCGVQESVVAQETRKFTLPGACFAPKAVMKGLHGGGHGTHPRSEVKGLSAAVDRFLSNEAIAARCAEPIAKQRPIPQQYESSLVPATKPMRSDRRARVYDAVEQALKSADLLVQTGGFSAIILDLGGIKPEVVSRIELSAWHRYRVAAEQTQSSIVLLSQYPCAKSSSELQLQLLPMDNTREERTVFTGLTARVEILRQRFAETPAKVVPMRKPPQRVREACWSQRTTWVGPR
ncbi:ATPase domain-containing protein [Terriglobus sp. TAA 43]|uniref:ATPase domain-containing protein n=1 Tax=Terriglobus sp. TAA 43 TaxID=278961 RepID=UPI000645941A|nr:ATPase domain-containing protein [Terriglobus sp. TAA 43]